MGPEATIANATDPAAWGQDVERFGGDCWDLGPCAAVGRYGQLSFVTVGEDSDLTTPSRGGTTAARPGRWRPVVIVGAVLLVAVLVFVGFAAVRDFQRQALPTPTFPSLAEAPDAALHGTVAFISEAKVNTDPRRQACARVALASGASARDVYCWPIDQSAQSTAVWTDDGRLLVTSFREPQGEDAPEPEWAKYVDVETGRVEDVPADLLGVGAEPSSGPRTNPEGQRLLLEGGGGEAVIHLFGPGDKERNLLEVTDANPGWSIQAGPVWSPDFDWVMSWDAGLLITTTSDTPRTRTLAEEASASPYGFDQPNFSILDRDLDLT